MLSDTESYNIEEQNRLAIWISFVRLYVLSKMIYQGVVRMAIIIGRKDNGELSGLRVDDKLLPEWPIYGQMVIFSLGNHDGRSFILICGTYWSRKFSLQGISSSALSW